MNRSSRSRRTLALGALLTLVSGARAAHADPAATPASAAPAEDVAIHLPPPPQRVVTIEWNPLAFFAIGRISANVAITPGDHHALVVSPFYVSTTTFPIYVYSDAGNTTQLPQQKFQGFGGELGYRYYFGQGGPRGLFVGPSIILASMTATAQDGAQTSYLDFGLAGDVGYQILVADRVSISLGAGLQYTATSKSIPDQQFPAEVYANDGLRPRVLASIGWGF